MSYSPPLASTITNTKMRTPEHVSPFSGMCAVCAANCTGLCEIGLSAIRGPEAMDPYQSNVNQFGSEKNYPLDFSHLNINGRVFGAWGCPADPLSASVPKVDIGTVFGLQNKVKITAPIILPAIAKLNWPDYFGGAALAGVPVVIGEGVVGKDPDLVLEQGKVVSSPLIAAMVAAFRKYYRGYGDVVLQANFDDEYLGLLDYAISKLGVKSVELKFGQAAKGIQALSPVPDLATALRFKDMGYQINPDPTDPAVVKNYQAGIGPTFEKIDKLPFWTEEILVSRVSELKRLGAERVCFKTGPFDPRDLTKIIQIAIKAEVDLITFDGAGGGSGHSPAKMMNEWGIPTLELESILYNILCQLRHQGHRLPQVAIAGGFVMEDQVFKGLALGAPYVNLVAIGRGAMAAALVGKQVGNLIKKGVVPKHFQRFGATFEEIFAGVRDLKGIYGGKAGEFPPGAVGVYSYLSRVAKGLKEFMALNRKFSLAHIERSDLIPLTTAAACVTGLPTAAEIAAELVGY